MRPRAGGGGTMPRAVGACAPRARAVGADTRRASIAKTLVAIAPCVGARRARARDGVVVVEETVGDGAEVLAGVDVVKVNYAVARASTGARVDSAKYFVFGVGAGEVVRGFDAIVGGDGTLAPMRAGGVRKARVPAALAYGDRGAGCDKTGNACSIPPGEDLVFTVELVEVK